MPFFLGRALLGQGNADLPDHERQLLRRQRRALWVIALGLFVAGTTLHVALDVPASIFDPREVLVELAILAVLLVAVGIASRITLAQTVRRLQADRAALQTALQAQERHDQQKDLVLASLSHDLRSPLTAIRGRVQLLQRRVATLPEPQRASVESGLQEIARTADRMSAMTEELLDVTRVQAGQPLELRREATDLVELARRAVADHEAAGSGHPLRLSTTAGSLVGEWDAARLARVLDNLLTNAEKYSPEGAEIDVRLSITLDGPGPWAVLAVQDRGIGIPATDLERVFEPLQRGTNVDGAADGVGLGLAGVRQIVEQHGGAVAVESAPGEGSTFTVRLPLDGAERSEVITQA